MVKLCLNYGIRVCMKLGLGLFFYENGKLMIGIKYGNDWIINDVVVGFLCVLIYLCVKCVN